MSKQHADMKVGGINASMTDLGVRGSFHADSIKQVRHFEKSEKGPGPDDHGCREFNIVELESNGTTFSLFLSTDSLGDLIEQATVVTCGISYGTRR